MSGVHDIALTLFAAAVAVAAIAMIAASLQLRKVDPEAPAQEPAPGFAETFARRSIYGLVLGAHHRRVGDRLLTTLVHVCRAAMLIAVVSGLWWKLG